MEFSLDEVPESPCVFLLLAVALLDPLAVMARPPRRQPAARRRQLLRNSLSDDILDSDLVAVRPEALEEVQKMTTSSTRMRRSTTKTMRTTSAEVADVQAATCAAGEAERETHRKAVRPQRTSTAGGGAR